MDIDAEKDWRVDLAPRIQPSQSSLMTVGPSKDHFDLPLSITAELLAAEAKSKRRLALPLTLLVYGVVSGSVFLLAKVGSQAVHSATRYVTISIGGSGDILDDPPPPPPPPPGGSPSAPDNSPKPVPDHNEDHVVVPVDIKPTVPTPDPDTPKDPGHSTDAPKGDPNGKPGGVAGGVPGGVLGGTPGGTPGGVLGGTPGGRGGNQSAIAFVTFEQVKVRFRPPRPQYPVLAKMQRVQGTVRILVTIGPDGVPIRADIKEGPEIFYASAKAYAMQWRFEPFMRDGLAQTAQLVLILPFTLS